MALTTAQKISLFEIINTPYTGDIDEMYGKYGLSAYTYEVSDDGKVQLKIHSRLANMSAEEEAVLITYISKWEALGTQTYVLDGGVGGVNGVSYSVDIELERIRDRVKNLIPVRNYWEDVKKTSDFNSISINTTR